MTTKAPSPSRRQPAAGSDRAVSEVLSYSLIFGLIVASIAIVTVGGMNSLDSARTNEQLSNAERAFDVLHDNLADVHSEGVPSRATEISLGDSQIYFGENVTMTVDLSSGNIQSTIRPIIFRVEGERQLIYEAGAVLRQEREGGVVLNEPPFAMVEGGGAGSGQVHLTLVETTSPDVQSMGSTTILVRGQSTNRTVGASDLSGSNFVLDITLQTPRYDVWADYFEQQDYCGSVTTNDGAEEVTCDVDGDYEPEQLYVTEQTIRIDLIQ